MMPDESEVWDGVNSFKLLLLDYRKLNLPSYYVDFKENKF